MIRHAHLKERTATTKTKFTFYNKVFIDNIIVKINVKCGEKVFAWWLNDWLRKKYQHIEYIRAEIAVVVFLNLSIIDWRGRGGILSWLVVMVFLNLSIIDWRGGGGILRWLNDWLSPGRGVERLDQWKSAQENIEYL